MEGHIRNIGSMGLKPRYSDEHFLDLLGLYVLLPLDPLVVALWHWELAVHRFCLLNSYQEYIGKLGLDHLFAMLGGMSERAGKIMESGNGRGCGGSGCVVLFLRFGPAMYCIYQCFGV